MTRELAEQRVSERWEYLGLNKAACPIMFGMDVDNMVEHPEDYIEVANQGKALQQGIDSLRVGDDSGGASSVCAPVESLPVPLTGNGVSGDGELPQGRSVSIADADSQILPSDTAHGIAGVQSTATDCTPEISQVGFVEALLMCLECYDVREQLRLEDIEAEAETNSYAGQPMPGESRY